MLQRIVHAHVFVTKNCHIYESTEKKTRHGLLYHCNLVYQIAASRKSYFWWKDVHFYGTSEPNIISCDTAVI